MKIPTATIIVVLILIVTNSQDATADYFCNYLKLSNEPYFRFDTDLFLKHYKIVYKHCLSDSSFDIFEQKSKIHFDSTKVTGIWYRRPVLPCISIEDQNKEVQRQLAFEARTQYEYILRTLDDAIWVSLPERLRLAEDRLMQLRYAESCGFSVPDTIISNRRDVIDEFLLKHERVCVKPIYIGQMILNDGLRLFYTSIISRTDIDFLSKVENFPVLLQEFIPKSLELRVTVVGSQVFPVEIDTKGDPEVSVDWRIENGKRVEFKQCKITLELSNMIMKLVKKFGIMFAAMDIILSENGNYYFLDLNPNGQWAWLDQNLKLGIAENLRFTLLGRQKYV